MKTSILLLCGYFGASSASAIPAGGAPQSLAIRSAPLLSYTLPTSRQTSQSKMSRRDLPPSDPGHYPPSQTALLFLDYQNVLVNMIADAGTKQTLIDSAKALLAAARKARMPIIHCLADTTLDPPPTNKVYNDWITVHKPTFEAMPELAAEYAELAPTNSTGHHGHESVSLRPPGYRSVLVADGLIPLLREELGVTHLILGGIATSGAVLGTATHGTDIDFVVTVVEEAVWDPNEQVHRNLLDVVFPTLAWVSSTEEALKYMKC